MSDQIKIQQDGRILHVTFNRAEGNGVSDSMAAALSEAVLNAHETSDCVVLTAWVPTFAQAVYAMQIFRLLQKLTHGVLNTILSSTVTRHCAVAQYQSLV